MVLHQSTITRWERSSQKDIIPHIDLQMVSSFPWNDFVQIYLLYTFKYTVWQNFALNTFVPIFGVISCQELINYNIIKSIFLHFRYTCSQNTAFKPHCATAADTVSTIKTGAESRPWFCSHHAGKFEYRTNLPSCISWCLMFTIALHSRLVASEVALLVACISHNPLYHFNWFSS